MNYELLTPVVRYCFYTLVEACSKLILDFYVAEKTQVKILKFFDAKPDPVLDPNPDPNIDPDP